MRSIHPAMTALTCVLSLAAAQPGAWHRQPAFSVDPAVLLQEARSSKAKEGQAVSELLEETLIVFDAKGGREARYRYVFRIDHESAINGWRSVGAVWEPWHQERPRIRARVITPDGTVHALDPATIGEFPINEEGTNLYDDRKRLGAPLPQLCLGAVAEVEVITRDLEPVHEVGTLGAIALHQPVPVMHTRIWVDVPESMPFQWKLVGLGSSQPGLTKENGRKRLSFEMGPTEPPEVREPYSDPYIQPQPVLSYSTVPSWRAASVHYAGIVERQLIGAELPAAAKEAMGDLVEPKEKINRLLAWINRTIRYTGVEFGEAGIVPRTPAETLKRGFGDCKDKATLLVALLHAAGIQAKVALLNTGPGKDVNPELPGLNHFDHAIVFVPGSSPLWIDPTAETARAGELPFPDQGRLALIVSPETTTLTRTPEARSLENMAVETREVFLADSGKARIVETSHPSGLAEMALRRDFAHAEPKKLQENLKSYVQKEYNASDLGETTVGDPSDFTRPFTVRVEALQSNIAVTSDVDAAVTINVWSMGKGFRNLIPTSYDRSEKDPVKARTQDLIFPEPYATEWQYKIVLPIGFEAKSLPESDRIAFGPASLTRTFGRTPEGVISATFRFDSGKARWTAAEVESARTSMEAFGKSAPTKLSFDQVGEAHLAAGRIKEAIQAFHIQAAAQPSKGVPLSRLAIALIQGGLGGAARQQARMACQLEPKIMFTHRALGWVLLHDLANRPYQKGWDYSGAIAAYRKAKELDPKDVLSRKNLALILEHNPEGERYGPGTRLDLAIQEYQELRKDLQVEDMNSNLLVVLWRANRFKEVGELAASLPTTSDTQGWHIAATAVLKGVQAALKEARGSSLDPSNRRAAMGKAGDTLVSSRYYLEAAAILSESADGDSNAPAIRSRVAVLAKTRRFEDVELDPNSPTSVIWRLMKSATDGSTKSKDLLKFLTPNLVAGVDNEEGLKQLRKALGYTPVNRDGTGASLAVGMDVILALSQVVVEGNEAAGYRVRIQMPWNAESKNDSWYVVREKGQLLLAAMDESPFSFGIEAFRRLDRGDAAGAKVMLDRAREVVWSGGGDEPLSGHPLCRFWVKGQEATAQEIRVAAASLLAPEKESRDAVQILQEGRISAKDDAARGRFDLALLQAHMARSEWAALEAVSERLVKANPSSKMAALARIVALAGSKKWPYMLKFADERLIREPFDAEFLGGKASALGHLGRLEEQEQLLKAAIGSGKATSMDFNNLAWGDLVRGKVTDQSIDWARRSVLLKPEKNGAAQHTLASLLAERGETTEALELFFKEVNSLEDEELRSQDWYLIGRIAEQFGEKDAAIDSYRRVSRPKETESEEESCHALAAKRLKVLGKS